MVGTRTVLINADWSLVTDKVGYLQFNDEMLVVVNGGEDPTGTLGYVVTPKEEYVNPADGIAVWAKSKTGGTAVESIRLIEESV